MTATAVPFPNLEGHQYANLTTFRKSGQGVPTPIWFTFLDGKLYIVTLGTSGKVKRIRNNPHVLLEPCDQVGKTLGPSLPGQARTLSIEEGIGANLALARRYGIFYAGFAIFWHFNGTAKDRVYLEITPYPESATV